MLVAMLTTACGVWAQAPIRAVEEKKVSPATAIVFENILKQSTIDFTLRSSISPQRYSIETMTGGVAVFDYDNDDLLDLFFTNGATIPELAKKDASFPIGSFITTATEPLPT